MYQNVSDSDCGFTHVSSIWPYGKFNVESNGTCCKVIGATTIELWMIL